MCLLYVRNWVVYILAVTFCSEHCCMDEWAGIVLWLMILQVHISQLISSVVAPVDNETAWPFYLVLINKTTEHHRPLPTQDLNILIWSYIKIYIYRQTDKTNILYKPQISRKQMLSSSIILYTKILHCSHSNSKKYVLLMQRLVLKVMIFKSQDDY